MRLQKSWTRLSDCTTITLPQTTCLRPPRHQLLIRSQEDQMKLFLFTGPPGSQDRPCHLRCWWAAEPHTHQPVSAVYATPSHSAASTLCDPMHCSPPGSSVREILQPRILEWVAIPSPKDLPDPGIEPVSPVSPASQADTLPPSPQRSPYISLYAPSKEDLLTIRWDFSDKCCLKPNKNK